MPTDLNDNPPKFTKSEYSVTIPEDHSIGSLVLQVSATDADESPQLLYEMDPLTSEDIRKTFALNHSSGELFLAIPLDYERWQQYKFFMLVKDAQINPHSSSATVIINISGIVCSLLALNNEPKN